MDMKKLIEQIYAAFNTRNTDEALKFMTTDVSWPKASEGGRVAGGDEIRAYWSRQWEAFDPHVEPLEILEAGRDKAHVRVHQLVKDLQGNILSDSEVWHEYTIKDGLIERMDIREDADNKGDQKSTAFSNHA